MKEEKTDTPPTKLNLSTCELFCRKICFRKNKNLEFLENCKYFIRKRLSVEKIMRDFYKVDKMMGLTINTFCLQDDVSKIPYKTIMENLSLAEMEPKVKIPIPDSSLSAMNLEKPS